MNKESLRDVLLVEHATDRSGMDGMVAGELILALKSAVLPGETALSFLRLHTRDHDFSRPAEREFVSAGGLLLVNGFFWIERALDRSVGPEADRMADPESSLPPCSLPRIVSWNPNRCPLSITRYLKSCRIHRIRVEERGAAFHLHYSPPNAPSSGIPAGTVRLDAFRRPRSELSPELIRRIRNDIGWKNQGSPASSPPSPGTADRGPNIVLIGEENHFQHEYPLVLAALGDAADEAGRLPCVDILSALMVNTREGRERLARADGIVLPGGGDMDQTEGQILAAGIALEEGRPLLGLCLGMQTMVVAQARYRLGLDQADLEEVKPDGPHCLFTRMKEAGHIPLHRLGRRTSLVTPGSRLARIYNREIVRERMNHRFRLEPRYIPKLKDFGLMVSAVSSNRRITDGIELTDHPFFIGLQGHPEMISRPGRPHPVIRAFVTSVTGPGA